MNDDEHDRNELTQACKARCTYANALVLYSAPCVIFWCVAVLLGGKTGLEFLDELRWDMAAPGGSPSVLAMDEWKHLFPQKLSKYEFSHGVLIEARHKWPSATHPAVAELAKHVLNETVGWCERRPAPRPQCWWRQAHGLFVPRTDADADASEADYLTADNKTGLIVIDTHSWGSAGNKQQLDAWKRLQKTIDAFLELPCAAAGVSEEEATAASASLPPSCVMSELYRVRSTHEQMMLYAAQTSVVGDFERGDLTTLPIALLVLIWAVGPLGLLVLLTLPTSVVCSFILLHQLANGVSWPFSLATVSFPSFAPAIFINMMIALSFDYTLFVLTRFHDGLVDGMSPLEALAAMLHHTGRVIVVSGATLAITFFGTTFCALGLVSALGWGGGVSCFVVVAVHLTLLPALLLALSPCYVRCGARRCLAPGRSPKARLYRWIGARLPSCGGCGGCCGRGGSGGLGGGGGGLGGGGMGSRRSGSLHAPSLRSPLTYEPQHSRVSFDEPLTPHANGALPAAPDASASSVLGAGGEDAIRGSFWISVGLFCRRRRAAILATFGLLLVPCCYVVGAVSRLSISQGQLTPRDAPSLLAYQAIALRGLNSGVLDPVEVVTRNDGRPGSDADAPPLGCVDDNAEVREFLLESKDELVRAFPPSLYTCGALKLALDICNATHPPHIIDGSGDRRSVKPLAKKYCAGTCENYCAPNASVISDVLFERTWLFRQRALTAVLEDGLPVLHADDVRDIATLPGDRSRRLNASEALALLRDDGENRTADAAAYQAQFHRLASYDRTSALIEVMLPRGQMGDGGMALLWQLRAAVETAPLDDDAFGFVLPGTMEIMMDAMTFTMTQAPTIMISTALVVIGLVAGVAFRSVLVPLRLALTLLATLLLVAASAVLWYQSLLRLDGLYWITPISCGCLIIGLTVDYDVFLISRVHELRLHGHTTEAAVLLAMATSADTITTAGLIMIVAFSALLTSSMTVLNQFGFMLVTAAFVDTFVVRAVLVPTLMFCAVEWNWWPGWVPEPTLELDVAAGVISGVSAARRGEGGGSGGSGGGGGGGGGGGRGRGGFRHFFEDDDAPTTATTAPLSAASISLGSLRGNRERVDSCGSSMGTPTGLRPSRTAPDLGGWASPTTRIN